MGPGGAIPDARSIELATRRSLICTCIGLLPLTESSAALPSNDGTPLTGGPPFDSLVALVEVDYSAPPAAFPRAYVCISLVCSVLYFAA